MQILCINDASPDGCAAILSDYADRDTRIRIFTHEQNQGPSGARNTGLDNAVGEYILFLDSDDWWEPGLVTAVVAKAGQTDADMVNFGCMTTQPDGSEIPIGAGIPEARLNGKQDWEQYCLSHGKGTGICACFCLFRNQIIQRNRLRFTDEKEICAEDRLFQLCYLPLCRKIAAEPVLYYRYDVHAGSQTSGFWAHFPTEKLFRLGLVYRAWLRKIGYPLYLADLEVHETFRRNLFGDKASQIQADLKQLAKCRDFRRMCRRLAFGTAFCKLGKVKKHTPKLRLFNRLTAFFWLLGLPQLAQYFI
jgi:glycosyltransferase involved in cell wall biosynthesis